MLLALIVGCGGDIIRHPTPGEDSGSEGLVLTSLDPAEGVAAGGTFVRVSGSGFTSASEVTVGGAPCAELTFLSSAELYCSTPAGPVGETELVVTEGEASASATFTYLADDPDTGEDTGEPTATITSCTLDEPMSLSVVAEDSTDPVLGSVVVSGRTEGEGQAPGIEAAVGFGPADADPSTWAWSTALYVGSVDPADQYSGVLYPDDPGTFAYTLRFRVDHGDWTVCTAAGGGYGSLEVTPPSEEVAVDYCHTQWPCAMEVAAGTESEPVYAWIYQGGVTQGTGQGAGIRMEIGVGDAGTDPTTESSWTWAPMAYNADKDGLTSGDKANDEYMGTFMAPTEIETFDYTARASADNGLTWTLCDLGGDSCNYGGSSDGYDDPGTCTVR